SCLIKRARVTYNLGYKQEAWEILSRIEEAFNRYNISRYDTLYSNFLNRKGYFLLMKNELYRARDCYLESALIRKKLEIYDYPLSYAYSNLGYIYNQTGDLTQAEKYFKKTLEIRKRILNPGDLRFASPLSNLGAVLTTHARYDEAERYLEKSKNIYIQEYGENHFVGHVYNNLGIIYSIRGDYSKALSYYERAIQLLIQIPGTYKNVIPDTYNNLGSIYLKMKDYEKALDWFLKSVEFSSTYAPGKLGPTYIRVADNYTHLGNYQLAEKYYQEAIHQTIRIYSKNRLNLARAYLNFGLFYTNQQDYEKGLDLHQKALTLYMTLYIKLYGPKHPRTSRCLYNIALSYKLQHNPDSALYYIQKSIIAVVDDFNNEDIFSNPSLNNVYSSLRLLNSLKSKADILLEMPGKENHNLDTLKLGFSTLESAISVIEKLRLEFETEESKLFLAQNERDTYNEIIQTALRLYESTRDEDFKEKAYEYTEKSKSAVLLSVLRGVEARRFGGIPENLINEEIQIKTDISTFKELLFEEKKLENPDSAKIKLYENYVFTLTNRYDSILRTFEQDYPDYFALKFNTAVVSPKELSHHLKKKDALLEFSISDSSLVTFLITRDRFLVHHTTVDSLFWFDLHSIRTNISTSNFENGVKLDYTRFIHASHNLYQILLKPFEEYLNNKNLIIVPDEILAYIPFEILLTNLPVYRGSEYHDLPYLVKDNPVSYSYSATLLLDNSREKKSLSNKVLAFAPGYEEPSEMSENLFLTRQEYRNRLYPLPYVEDEIKSIKKLTKGRVLTGENATESAFKSLSSEYDILHLAMHTLIDDENPLYSKLAFTFIPGDTLEDGFLNAIEIYNLSLKARLTVLSSCSSGFGKFQKGEGVMSLARSFMYAGCPSVVMTLWEVEDNSGAEIMSKFYFYLKKGYSKDKALRKAKLKFFKKKGMLKSHPYFWAPYISIGDQSRIYFGRPLKLIFLGSLILLFAIVSVRIRKRKLL
ncbi:MAG: tetratricopeptide repeat protein, partial [Bacteroidales bacterium]|nr:tetratricopeptide repeat protein [Bacteroidales bacterium]